MKNALPETHGKAVQGVTLQGRRRGLPSKVEQERRVAWGKEWGKLVRDGYQRMLQERA